MLEIIAVVIRILCHSKHQFLTVHSDEKSTSPLQIPIDLIQKSVKLFFS